MIGIVDYGAGNLNSVNKALAYLGAETMFIRKEADFGMADRVVLPGVGAFGHAVLRLEEDNLKGAMTRWIQENKPFLGICLGFQLFFEASMESPGAEGLGLFPGSCRRFQAMKVPQIGWNSITIKKATPLLRGIRSGEYFYFVHSYHAPPVGADFAVAETEYVLTFPSIAAAGNVYGVQFHPEKSGEAGLKLLKNWMELC